jgi:hypothetical protein
MKTDLTFAELRLANMLTPPKDTNISFTAELDLAHENDLESALVEMVLVADKLAAQANIDLAAAIRRRFDPVGSPPRNKHNPWQT